MADPKSSSAGRADGSAHPGAAPRPAAPTEATECAVLAALRRAINVELGLAREVRLEDDLVSDLQLDSMGLLTVVVEVENTFRIALREEDSASVRTVRDLVSLVQARTRGGP